MPTVPLVLAYDCDWYTVLVNSNTYLRIFGGSHGYLEQKDPAIGPFLQIDAFIGLLRLDIGACLVSHMIVTTLRE